MLKCYDATETAFNHNGIKILNPLTAQVYKEDNGDYYLDLEASIDNIEWLIQGNIVSVNTPWGWQCFRLGNPEIKNRVISMRAKHLYFDTTNYVVKDVIIENSTALNALNMVLAGTDQTTPFSVSSDIETLCSLEIKQNSLEEAIALIVNTWGAHLERDNLSISLKQNIGADRGVTIAYGKNLTEFKAVENWDNVVTKILPVSNDDIMLPEEFLLADIQYNIPYTKKVTFSLSDGVNAEDDNAVIEDLRNQALKYLDVYKYPQVNYTVNAHIENVVDIGDTIDMIHKNSNTNLQTQVKSVKYDCILGKFKSIEFGNYKNNLKSLIKSINSQIDNVKKDNEIKYSNLSVALQDAKNTINRYLFEGHRYETDNATYFLDTDDISTANDIMMISLGGISFGHDGIDGEFSSAWTIDGKFVADFITTGTLSSILLKSSNYVTNTIGMQINLADGTIDSKRFKVSSDGSMTCENATLTGGLIKSSNYVANSTGMSINLSNGVIDSKNLKVSSDGTITANNGNFSGNISASNITGSTFLSEYDYNGTLMRTSIVNGRIDSNLINILDFNGNIISSLSAGGMYFANDNYYDSNGVKTGNIICSDVNAVDIDCTSISINGSVPITALNKNDYTYPPSGHTHTQLNGGFTPVTLYSNTFRPESDDVLMNGSPSYRWSTVYASTSTISTSDRNQKHDITNLDDIYRQIILKLRPVKFKYNNGSSNRWHTGFISNDVEILLEELGLSSYDFAAFIKSPIYEIIDEETGEYDTSSAIVGYLYGLRYEEFISPTISLVQEQDKKINELEQRLLKLEVA